MAPGPTREYFAFSGLLRWTTFTRIVALGTAQHAVRPKLPALMREDLGLDRLNGLNCAVNQGVPGEFSIFSRTKLHFAACCDAGIRNVHASAHFLTLAGTARDRGPARIGFA